MGAEYPGALWIPSSHFGYGQGATNQNTHKWIIVHGTAGFTRAEDVAVFFQNNNPATSVHYVIGQDGTIVQCVAENDAAWGNGVLSNGHDSWWSNLRNPNLDTISIEHVKPDPQNATPLTPAQQKASFELIAYLCAKYHIPARKADANGGITGHYSIDPVNRSFCPNVYPWAELWASLGGNEMGVPTNWHDDGQKLTAPNGHTVKLGNRQFVLDNAWDSDNWPIEEEHEQNPLEAANPALGKGTQQAFRWTVLEWVEARNKVIIMWSGPEMVAQRNRANALQSQVDVLQGLVGASAAIKADAQQLAADTAKLEKDVS